jgi:hypothetical protein
MRRPTITLVLLKTTDCCFLCLALPCAHMTVLCSQAPAVPALAGLFGGTRRTEGLATQVERQAAATSTTRKGSSGTQVRMQRRVRAPVHASRDGEWGGVGWSNNSRCISKICCCSCCKAVSGPNSLLIRCVYVCVYAGILHWWPWSAAAAGGRGGRRGSACSARTGAC